MLKITEEQIEKINTDYPGIRDSIHHYESAILPNCKHCDSPDTASVQVGVVQRTMNIAVATTKFKLTPNGPKRGQYFCNACSSYFD